jgi:hypothetical protein
MIFGGDRQTFTYFVPPTANQTFYGSTVSIVDRSSNMFAVVDKGLFVTRLKSKNNAVSYTMNKKTFSMSLLARKM